MRFGALLTGPGASWPQPPGEGWRRPDADPRDVLRWAPLLQTAAKLADGGVDFLFAADVLSVDEIGPDDHARLAGSVPIVHDPVTLMSMVAAATPGIGVVPTISTTFQEPYDVARRLATLDHLSGGRAGWNVVASRGVHETANFGHLGAARSGDREQRLLEFVEVVDRLWDSWDDTGLLLDKESGVAIREHSVRPIDHRGANFQVAGPLSVPRPPQGRPVTFLAGAGSTFARRAARVADAVFTMAATREAARSTRAHLDHACAEVGRDPASLKVFVGLNWLVADDQREADRLHRHRYGGRPDADRPGGGHLSVTGTPDRLRQVVQQWDDDGCVDGFIAIPFNAPEDIDALLASGVIETTGADGGLRQRLGLPELPARF